MLQNFIMKKSSIYLFSLIIITLIISIFINIYQFLNSSNTPKVKSIDVCAEIKEYFSQEEVENELDVIPTIEPSFYKSKLTSIPTPCFSQIIELKSYSFLFRDFNGDGKTDLALRIAMGSEGTWYELFLNNGQEFSLINKFSQIPSPIYNATSKVIQGKYRGGADYGTYTIYKWEGQNIILNKVIKYQDFGGGIQERCLLEGSFDSLDDAEKQFDKLKVCTTKDESDFKKQKGFGEKEIEDYFLIS